MDNPTLIRILGQTPETRLKLLDLAERWAIPAQDKMQNRTPEQEQELEQATAEASNYTSGTRRLSRAIRRMAMLPSG